MSKKAKRKHLVPAERKPTAPTPPKKGLRPKIVAPLLLVAVISITAWLLWRAQRLSQSPNQANVPPASKNAFKQPTTFLELCNTPTEQLEKCDIALMNLLCAEGLPGAENLNVRETLERLDGIARKVQFETDRHIYKFRQHPEEFNQSEGYYRMMMMATVLQQDLGIHYNPERIQMPWEPLESDEKFFANSQDVLIHGLAREGGTGTCSSMPVFYVAIGRRLQYPLKLVTAKGHLFARWEDGQKTFNIEGTSIGFVSHPDEYYRNWPAFFTPEEQASEGYLQSLTPVQELAVFLSIRGACLRAAKDYLKSLGALAEAHRRQPNAISYQRLFARAEHEAYVARVLPRKNAIQYALRTLEIPPEPSYPYFLAQKTSLEQMFQSGVDEAQIEAQLDSLQAEISATTASRYGR